MIGVEDLSVSLGGRPVLHGVSFAAAPGSFVALCGPNGAGKTTLLRALAGLLPGGKPQPRTVAYLPQNARCAWNLTVRQIAALGRLPHGDTDAAAIEAAMDQCGVAALADRPVATLSGGQARRAMLARAFATQPRALLLDEPVADLDPAAAHEILVLLRRFAASGGTVVAVLHAIELACRTAHRLCLLQNGRVLADGPPADMLPQAAAAFGMRLSQEIALAPLHGTGEAGT